MGSRLPDKVFAYCDKIALKIARGEAWQRDWDVLIKTLYTKDGNRTLAGALGLPSSIPPYNYESGDMAALLNKFEEKLTQLGEEGQLANIDLQDQLQKQQQTLHLLSSVSKQLNDTAIDVIRNIG